MVDTCDFRDVYMYPDVITPARVALFTTELVLNTTALASGTAFLVTFRLVTSIRYSSKFLLYSVLIANHLTTLSRFVIITNAVTGNKWPSSDALSPTAFLHDIAITMNTYAALAIAIDCLTATFLPVRRYPRVEVWFTAILSLLPWALAVFGRTLNTVNFKTLNAVNLFYAGLNVVCWVLLIALAVRNSKAYRASAGDVTEKYEVTVQIRTLQTMMPMVFFSTVRNLITTGAVMFILYYQLPNCLLAETRISAHVFDLAVAAYSAFVWIPVVRANSQAMQIIRQKILRRNGVAEAPLRNALGQQLVTAQDQNAYFEALRKAWE